MKRKDEPARERMLTPWRPDTELRKAVDEFCDRHGISKQEFLDRAAKAMMGRGGVADETRTQKERDIAARAVVCYRESPEETLVWLRIIENHIKAEK